MTINVTITHATPGLDKNLKVQTITTTADGSVNVNNNATIVAPGESTTIAVWKEQSLLISEVGEDAT